MTINFPVPPAIHLLQTLLERAEERHRDRQAFGESSSSSSSNEEGDDEGEGGAVGGGADRDAAGKEKKKKKKKRSEFEEESFSVLVAIWCCKRFKPLGPALAMLYWLHATPGRGHLRLVCWSCEWLTCCYVLVSLPGYFMSHGHYFV